GWACKHTLASQLPRLVSKQWSKRRDDRDKSGINEVLNHRFYVLVCRRCFFVEQIALFADDAATEAGLGEFSNTEAFAHAKPSFAAGPLTTSAVSERQGMTFAIAGGLHEIAQRATRASDYDEVTLDSDGPFAVEPNSFITVVLTGDAVVATLPKA